ncbi:DUF2268 domain-containing putative Zn-dependent protease [Pontibacter actiniarum]|uniref:DUF2268 domain-containing putative Zn-dependent protease n=1 Tax=Pontibacter actiniarum TaxID=323450 RepID=UPI0013C51FCA|nr:DUF2268 domain-containing putative Zn-dependent protease [Pontibacter actiniarum]
MKYSRIHPLTRSIAAALFLSGTAVCSAFGQGREQKVITADIDNFWIAYDSIRSTTDSLQQLHYIQTLYIDKGTPGLKAFMEAKGYNAEQGLRSIRNYPRFWDSIRPNTQQARAGAKGMEPYLKKLKKLYPALKPAKIYFVIGALQSSGTGLDAMVLVGAEMATGDPETDISEFPQNWQVGLGRYFNSQPFQNIIPLNIHEYVHTQQKGYGNNLLGRSIMEGTADFITELVTGKKMPLPYMVYGAQHEEELKEKFKKQMFAPYINNWFYNLSSAHPDLGYYMGYAICKTYYSNAKNKKQAIREMIELDFTSDKAVEAFLQQSHYFPDAIDKVQLLQAYEGMRPVVSSIKPLVAGDSTVDASTKEICISFSTEMGPTTGVKYGAGGKEQWPLVGKGEFSADRKSCTFKVDLSPGKEYDFIVSEGFMSAEGYPLKPFRVRFKTPVENQK